MTSSDPTDSALAAIASILDRPAERPLEKQQRKPDATIAPVAQAVEDQAVPAPDSQPVVEPVDIDGYSKTGPGPLDAIRFRWTARRDEAGNYFVDETIGESSRPLTSGPMARDDVVQFIDDREREASQRFNALKSEMSSGLPAADNGAGGDDSV